MKVCKCNLKGIIKTVDVFPISYLLCEELSSFFRCALFSSRCHLHGCPLAVHMPRYRSLCLTTGNPFTACILSTCAHWTRLWWCTWITCLPCWMWITLPLGKSSCPLALISPFESFRWTKVEAGMALPGNYWFLFTFSWPWSSSLLKGRFVVCIWWGSHPGGVTWVPTFTVSSGAKHQPAGHSFR